MLDKFSVLDRRFTTAFFGFPCSQRILMVADSSLNFGTAGFGLSEFVGIVRAAGHTVATAHRSGTNPGASLTITGNFNFATAATAVTVANYDQIWLFGFSTAPLSAPEQAQIAQFMRNGGGVFATGDHSNIGAGMGANLPRIRGMRDWSSIPMATPQRLDTVLDHGADAIKQFDDQADAIAQRMFPVFFSNGGDPFVASTWSVHPVLRHSSGAVDYLPDHPHESECRAPTPVAGNFAGVEEWPTPVAGGARIAPVVVAVSISAGRFIVNGAPTGTGTKPPVYPRSFGAISAYDGDAAQVGRIVCDATWHHYVNINLNGSGGAPDSLGNPRRGLYSAPGVPTPEYLKIQTYFRNTVNWLAPRGRRICWPLVVGVGLRFDAEIAELRLPHPHPCPWDPMIEIGRAAEQVLIRSLGPGALEDMVDALLASGGEKSPFTALLDTSLLRAERNDKSARSLLPLQDLRRGILGAFVNALSERLPEDEAKLKALGKRHHEVAHDAIAAALRHAEQATSEYLDTALRATAAQLKVLRTEVPAPVARPKAAKAKPAGKRNARKG